MATRKTQAPLFRGATKPTLFMGIPLTAFLMVSLPVFIGGMFLSFFIGYYGYLLWLFPIIALPIMRELTKRDDQYLRMLGLNYREKILMTNNRFQDLFFIPPKKSRFIE